MASAAQSVATIELLVKGATGGGAAAAPGAGAGGKPPKRTPAELKKFQQDKMASQQRAPGGAVQRALHKVGGAKPGSVQKEGASRHPMMGIAKESLKQGSSMVKAGGKAAGISASIGSLLKQSQLFTGVIGTIFQILGMLVDVIIMPFMPILVPVIKLFAKSVPILMFLMNNTIGLAVKLIVGYLSFVVNFWKGILTLLWTKIMKPIWDLIWSKIGGPITTGINAVTGFLGNLISPIWEAIMSVWNKIKDPSQWFSGPLHPVGVALDVLKGAFKIITDIVKGAWNIARVIIQGIWNIIKMVFNVYKAIFKLYFDVIKAIINTIITIIKGAWDVAKGIFNGVWDFIKTAFTGIKDFLSGVIDGIKSVFSGAWELFKSIFNAAVDFIKGIPGKIWGFLQDIWGIIKAIVTMYLNAIITVKDWAVGILQKIKDFFLGVWDTAKQWFSTARQWVIDKIKDWAANFVSAIITVKDWAVGIFQKIKDFFTTLKDTVINWFTTAKQWIIDAFKTWLSNFVTGVILIKDKVVGMAQKVKEIFIGIWDGAKEWVTTKISTIKDFFTGLWDKAKTLVGLIKEKVISIFDKIDTIRKKVVSVIEMINPLNWIPKIVEKIKGLIPSPGELVDNIPGVGTVKNVASKLKFWGAGAIVSKPTLGVAGEAGPEIIAPLKVLGTLKFLQPIFQGVKGIMGILPKMGGLVHKFAGMVNESFGRLFGDIFPKIGDVLLKIGQLGKMGLDMFDRFGKMYIQSTKMKMEMTKTTSSKALNFVKSIANNIDSRLLNLQKAGEMQIKSFHFTNYLLKGDLGILKRNTGSIADSTSYLPMLNRSLKSLASSSASRPPVTVTVINRTNEGRENQANFTADKRRAGEIADNYEFDNPLDAYTRI